MDQLLPLSGCSYWLERDSFYLFISFLYLSYKSLVYSFGPELYIETGATILMTTIHAYKMYSIVPRQKIDTGRRFCSFFFTLVIVVPFDKNQSSINQQLKCKLPTAQVLVHFSMVQLFLTSTYRIEGLDRIVKCATLILQCNILFHTFFQLFFGFSIFFFFLFVQQ